MEGVVRGVQIEPDEVRAIASQMAEINQVVTARMNQLMDRLADLKSLWQGPAAESFDATRADWQERAADHNDRLAVIAQQLTMAQADFASDDEKGAVDALAILKSVDRPLPSEHEETQA